MSILQQLRNALNQEQRSIATITGKSGDGKCTAKTQAGANLILIGAAEVGQRVFYDVRSGRILGDAPKVEITDIVLY